MWKHRLLRTRGHMGMNAGASAIKADAWKGSADLGRCC